MLLLGVRLANERGRDVAVGGCALGVAGHANELAILRSRVHDDLLEARVDLVARGNLDFGRGRRHCHLAGEAARRRLLADGFEDRRLEQLVPGRAALHLLGDHERIALLAEFGDRRLQLRALLALPLDVRAQIRDRQRPQRLGKVLLLDVLELELRVGGRIDEVPVAAEVEARGLGLAALRGGGGVEVHGVAVLRLLVARPLLAL